MEIFFRPLIINDNIKASQSELNASWLHSVACCSLVLGRITSIEVCRECLLWELRERLEYMVNTNQ